MSAVPRQPGHSYTGLRMTADEYLALGETDERYELIDGVVCMSPKPSRDHQRILSLLIFECELYKRAHPGFEYYPDIDIRFDARHVLEPDMCCYLPGRTPPRPAVLDVPPDLTIEILSPSNKKHDLVKKRAAYERFGVREYWVIDPDDANVRCFRRRNGELVEFPTSAHTIASEAIQGLVLDLRTMREQR